MVPWYRLETVCLGHEKAVNDIAFDPTGCMIATCGDDSRVILWNCRGGERLQLIRVFQHGPVLRIRWYANAAGTDGGSRTEAAHDNSMLLFGCADGTLHHYQYHHQTELLRPIAIYEIHCHSIQSIAYDLYHARAAVTADQSLAVLEPGVNSHFQFIWKYQHRYKALARSVHFLRSGEHLLVLYLETREAIRLEASTGAVLRTTKLRSRIGSSAVSPDGAFLLVGNLSTGVEMYETDTLTCVAVYQKRNHINVMKQVGFVNGNRLMMSGSDCGLVWLWDCENTTVQNLSHSSSKFLVQTVQAFSSGELRRIATASCDLEGKTPSIKVWRCDEIDKWRRAFLMNWPYALGFLAILSAFVGLKYYGLTFQLRVERGARIFRASLGDSLWFQYMY